MGAPLALHRHLEAHAGEGAEQRDFYLRCVDLQVAVILLIQRLVVKFFDFVKRLSVGDHWHIIRHKVDDLGQLNCLGDEEPTDVRHIFVPLVIHIGHVLHNF